MKCDNCNNFAYTMFDMACDKCGTRICKECASSVQMLLLSDTLLRMLWRVLSKRKNTRLGLDTRIMLCMLNVKIITVLNKM